MSIRKYARVDSLIQTAYEVEHVQLELAIMPGYPKLVLNGCKQRELQESCHRVQTILKDLQLPLPKGRLQLYLKGSRQASLHSGLDLPLLLAFLQIMGRLPSRSMLAYGRMNLKGELQSEKEWAILLAATAESLLPEALWTRGRELVMQNFWTVRTARDLLEEKQVYRPFSEASLEGGEQVVSSPLASAEQDEELEVFQGQERAFEALCLALAGQHSLLLIGSPGCGKSALLSMSEKLLPSESREERRQHLLKECLAGKSCAELVKSRGIKYEHYQKFMLKKMLTAQTSGQFLQLLALVDGGFLQVDDLQLLSPLHLQMIRQSREKGEFCQKRAGRLQRQSCRYQLLASMNPCPCGRFLSEKGGCSCSASRLEHYWRRLDASFLDRLDMVVVLSALDMEGLKQLRSASGSQTSSHKYSSKALREKIASCRQRLASEQLPFAAEAEELMHQLAQQYGWSGRSMLQAEALCQTLGQWRDKREVGIEEVGELAQLLCHRATLLPTSFQQSKEEAK